MEQVLSNQMLLSLILNQLTSPQLLHHRIVCKLWRDEANHLIRLRQQKFFFSPYSKTELADNHNDEDRKNTVENSLQISFIYSHVRDTFIRVTRRFMDSANAVFDLEGSSVEPAKQESDSAFFQEIEDFYKMRPPRSISQPLNLNCKTVGFTLDQFMDYFETTTNQTGDFDDHAIISHMNFRFDCGHFWGRPDIGRFFRVLGPKIQYLTLGLDHFCKRQGKTRFSHSAFDQWDDGYEIFKEVPNLEVLTIVPSSHWTNRQPRYRITDRHELEKLPEKCFPQNDTKADIEPFLRLKILRIARDQKDLAPSILSMAKRVERVVYEEVFSPDDHEFLSEISLVLSDTTPKSLDLLPHSLRLITPITKLYLNIFINSPQVLQLISQVINLQQVGRGQRVKSLSLFLVEKPDGGSKNPFNTPTVPPLLRILQAVAQSLETLRLTGGAALFLEGLLQLQRGTIFDDDDQQDQQRLERFPNVRKLAIDPTLTYSLERQDFCVETNLDLDLDLDPSLTSTTTLSKVFPRVEKLQLEYLGDEENMGLWCAFLPRSDLLRENVQDFQGQSFVDEVKSVKMIYLGLGFVEQAFDVWKFSNLETLCLDYAEFCNISSKIWSLDSLQTLTIDQIQSGTWYNGNQEPQDIPPMLEILCTSDLTEEVIRAYASYAARSLQTLPRKNHEQCLNKTRTALKSRVNTPSILDLNRLRHLKLLYHLGNSERTDMEEVIGFLLLGLLPLTCHITIWAMHLELPLMSLRMLQKEAGRKVSSHPRVSLRTVRYDEPVNSMLF